MLPIEDFLAQNTAYTTLTIDGVKYVGPIVSTQC